LAAGVRLLPFNLLAAFGGVLVNMVAEKARIPPIYLILIGSIIELIGLVLLSTLPGDGAFTSHIYGYQALAGFGIGFAVSILSPLIPHLVEPRDLGTFSQ
jgi:hypothetical protein